MKFDPEVNPILEFIQSASTGEETREYAFKNAVDFYNRKKYFEAHEIFEFQWKKEIGSHKLFLQALIQISVAMNKLFVSINLKGAKSQARLALEKLLHLQSSQCFSQKGSLYASLLIENLENLIKMLDSDLVDYSCYSPPEILPDPKDLFL